MDKRIMAKDLVALKDYLVLDDVIYLPSLLNSKKALAKIARVVKKTGILEKILPEFLSHATIESKLMVLREKFLEFSDNRAGEKEKPEPDWFARLPERLQKDLKACEAIYGEQNDNFTIVLKMPYSSINYLIKSQGLAEQIIRGFNLWRLHSVRQLANLITPSISAHGINSYALKFNHTRLLHTLDVYAIISLMLNNNQSELGKSPIGHAKIAALIHDALTPAGGDGIKLVDAEAFDEDKNIGQLLKGSYWRTIKQKFNLDRVFLILSLQRLIIGAIFWWKLFPVISKLKLKKKSLKRAELPLL